ncbi:hypothetical protein BBUBOL26_N24 (plasmid) [Borreliella burgdorferi Bol26]|uniref:Uncharacterized protein n=1 Tax=Borreliella burgdorferi (strain ZS7) TaxID=445985 RepID=A0A0H3C3F3_BORBZ|nr:hypothetical protein BbuZS7_N25 [Borreliella burgdorferi ZS7]ACN24429.1 hypothetical protein BBU64B_N0011 [Borreliella burgdorferi 64b]ACO37944.1 hypothetical protein BBUBOL26_N24 [Borreliella burgdorferi Bol26]
MVYSKKSLPIRGPHPAAFKAVNFFSKNYDFDIMYIQIKN